MTPTTYGAVSGMLASTGVLLVATYAPPARRQRLEARLAPYLRDTVPASRLLRAPRNLTPFPTLERVLGLREITARMNRTLGGADLLRRRLVRAGRGDDDEAFRAEQVAWGAAGTLVALIATVLLTARGHTIPPAAAVLLAGSGTLAGVVSRDRWLTHEVARRETRILAEFPTVAELLALAVTAGEGSVAALERVTRLAGGALAGELRLALADARTGVSLVAALEGVAQRTGIAPIARFVDGFAIAVERGTPLAEVLRAQAGDVREAGRRALMEAAGRREISMLVPVVFLILPVTVVFALWPGFFGLRGLA